MSGLFLCEAPAEDQDVEGFTYAGGSGEVLELERDFGSFLGQAAVLEGVGKLGVLADSDQELRLREQAE